MDNLIVDAKRAPMTCKHVPARIDKPGEGRARQEEVVEVLVVVREDRTHVRNHFEHAAGESEFAQLGEIEHRHSSAVIPAGCRCLSAGLRKMHLRERGSFGEFTEPGTVGNRKYRESRVTHLPQLVDALQPQQVDIDVDRPLIGYKILEKQPRKSGVRAMVLRKTLERPYIWLEHVNPDGAVVEHRLEALQNQPVSFFQSKVIDMQQQRGPRARRPADAVCRYEYSEEVSVVSAKRHRYGCPIHVFLLKSHKHL